MPKQRNESQTGSLSRRVRAAGIGWHSLLSVCLLALFALQGIVAQGHTHSQRAGASVALFGDVVIATTDNAGGNPATPNAPDTPDCGLCQSLSSGAAPLALAILVLLLPAPKTGPPLRFIEAPLFTASAVSFSWTSRGPPVSTPLHA